MSAEPQAGGAFHELLASFDFDDNPSEAWPVWADLYTTETDGTMYGVATTSTTPPSAQQVKDGQDHTGAAAAHAWSWAVDHAGYEKEKVEGLTVGTRYYFYQVHETTGNVLGSVTFRYSRLARSKNVASGGPLAAHVFETPGTYNVSMTVQKGDYSDTETVEITVADPDVYYAGAATIYVSSAGDFSAAPGGATTSTSIPTGEDLREKRILILGGETHVLPAMWTGEYNTQFGRFGAPELGPAKVRWIGQRTASGAYYTGNWPSNVTFLEGCDVWESEGSVAGTYRQGFADDYTVNNFLFVKTNLYNSNYDAVNSIPFALAELTMFSVINAPDDTVAARFTFPKGNIAYEMEIDRPWDAEQYMSIIIYTNCAHQQAYLGCYFDKSFTELTRHPCGIKMLMEQCRSPGRINPLRPRNIIKFHANGDDAFEDPPTAGKRYESAFNILRNNDFHGGMGDGADVVALAPQDNGNAAVTTNYTVQKLRDCIIEGNAFRLNPAAEPNNHIIMLGQNMTSRNNEWDTGDPCKVTGQTLANSFQATGNNYTASIAVDGVTSPFQKDEWITGETSGARALITSASGTTPTDTLSVNFNFDPRFEDNENISGSMGGSGVANIATANYARSVFVWENLSFMGPYFEYDGNPPGWSEFPGKDFLVI